MKTFKEETHRTTSRLQKYGCLLSIVLSLTIWTGIIYLFRLLVKNLTNLDWNVLALGFLILLTFITSMYYLLQTGKDFERQNRQLRYDIWLMMIRLNGFNSKDLKTNEKLQEIDSFWKGYEK